MDGRAPPQGSIDCLPTRSATRLGTTGTSTQSSDKASRTRSKLPVTQTQTAELEPRICYNAQGSQHSGATLGCALHPGRGMKECTKCLYQFCTSEVAKLPDGRWIAGALDGTIFIGDSPLLQAGLVECQKKCSVELKAALGDKNLFELQAPALILRPASSLLCLFFVYLFLLMVHFLFSSTSKVNILEPVKPVQRITAIRN